MTGLRLAFMGTPDFAAEILAALLASPHRIAAVYCQPPRPAGRGHAPRPSPVQTMAEAAGLPVRHPQRFDETAVQEFSGLALDVAVVAAYGLILPRPVLAAPRHGCLNVHASLLPRWRGAAPIERALLAGDSETGITIMQMEEGLDTGPMLRTAAVKIGLATTAAELHEELAALGARLLLATLDDLAACRLAPQPQPQPAEGATYAKKLRREEGRLDWRLPAAALERAIRALNPAPGTWFELGDERIKVLAAETVPGRPGAAPGTVLDDRLAIACAAGALRPLLLQRAGRGALETSVFLRGFPIAAGTLLPCPATD